MKWLAALIAGVALLAAGAGIASPTSAAKSHGCPPTSKAATLPKRAGKPMYADVDGDGLRDRITMRTVHHSQCPFFLLVQTRLRDYAVRIPRFFRNLSKGREPFPALGLNLGNGREEVAVAQ